ncbi:hypothetical protein [Capnocytophaga sputigena]|uniref:hypothetical protein n=1 Tax=Capnocytophaga sputigena TaxID=1019 RepID=UPI0028E3ABCF|nr:hypothetical protein [Capnocytophaga sputigena]
MKKVLLHHTCKQDGGKDQVLKEAPFFAKENQQLNKEQFLGSGYYLWEDDIEQAKYWGKERYNNQYYIVAFQCEIDEDFLLDLNSREGQKEFFELYSLYEKRAKQINQNVNKIPLNTFFNFWFKGKSGIKFAYKTIKVKDEIASLKREQRFDFTFHKPNYTYLGGVYFYFFKRKEDMNVINKEIVK